MESFYLGLHKLSAIDPNAKRAICAVCGPADILRRSDGKHRTVPWKCANQSRERARAKYHGVPVSERVRAWEESSERPRRAVIRQRKRQNYRTSVIAALGGRCSDPRCAWINEDGTRGCSDYRCLQVDHVHGDGSLERVDYGNAGYYQKVMENAGGRYQLLCSNCNWIKRVEKQEDRRHVIHRTENLKLRPMECAI